MGNLGTGGYGRVNQRSRPPSRQRESGDTTSGTAPSFSGHRRQKKASFPSAKHT
ncbi:hypothetical protein [Azospirillum largimobile]